MACPDISSCLGIVNEDGVVTCTLATKLTTVECQTNQTLQELRCFKKQCLWGIRTWLIVLSVILFLVLIGLIYLAWQNCVLLHRTTCLFCPPPIPVVVPEPIIVKPQPPPPRIALVQQPIVAMQVQPVVPVRPVIVAQPQPQLVVQRQQTVQSQLQLLPMGTPQYQPTGESSQLIGSAPIAQRPAFAQPPAVAQAQAQAVAPPSNLQPVAAVSTTGTNAGTAVGTQRPYWR